MQFKYPEFLLALFFLLIPLIIHLFRFRKFKTEYFTNVKFLKAITKESRKSSQLKKWLVLCMRLLALCALIFAFAQPYRPHDTAHTVAQETIIYLDNSLSMQQKGEKGELLKQAVQEVVQEVPEDREVVVITNDRVYPKAPLAELKTELLKIDYSRASDDFNTLLLKAENLSAKGGASQKQLIAISDFQKKNFPADFMVDSTLQLQWIQLRSRDNPNFSIDSLVVEGSDAEMINLEAFLSASREVEQELTVDLYDGEDLYAKNSAHFDQSATAQVQFSLPREQEIRKGRLEINDHQLQFDNVHYFTLQHTQQIKVVALSEDADRQEFMDRIYRDEQFEVEQQLLRNLNYNTFEGADFIVLNELQRFPAGISNILQQHLENGGAITIIPSLSMDLENYNQLLSNLEQGRYSRYRPQAVKITGINFSHPLYKGVFEEQIDNFQYPEVEGYYPYRGGNWILNYNNEDSFLSGSDPVYIFSSPLSKTSTNFKQSPLIVPTLYNMALQSAKLPRLAYRLGDFQKVDVKAQLKEDEVIHLKKDKEDIIPPQQQFNAKVELDISNYPEEAGLYTLRSEEENLGVLAFNDSRAESDWRFMDFKEQEAVNLHTNLKEVIEEEEYRRNEDSYWKWFVTFALVFVIGEFLLLRYLK